MKLTTFVALALATCSVGAQTRLVIVNGQRLSDAEIAELARVQCSEIPNGSYWLDPGSGVWGYAGNPVAQGRLGDACNGGINRDGTFGPFATMRRAEEVATDYRRRGQQAVAFHNGDGYYVRVRR